MRISRASYYGDFIVFPAIAAALAVTALATAPPPHWATWVGLTAFGVMTWTFMEYILHRFVLHHVPYIKDMHEAHHDDQTALIGTPTWVSLTIMLTVILVPLWYVAGYFFASALSAGLIIGYLWYVTVHHAVHHWKIKAHNTYLYHEKRRHAQHHYTDETCNFGVTSGFWDVIFGTTLAARGIAAPQDIK
jgi:sterol desaturase/sphingolipid hydroxylase (fatty acid hydroxylase superfamily)